MDKGKKVKRVTASPGLRPGIRVWVTFYPNKYPRNIIGGKLGTVWLDEHMAERARGFDGVILTGIVREKSAPRSASKASRPTPRNPRVPSRRPKGEKT